MGSTIQIVIFCVFRYIIVEQKFSLEDNKKKKWLEA